MPETIDVLDLIENPTATPTPGQYVRVREGAGVVVKAWFPPVDNSAEIALANFRSERERLFTVTEWVRQRHADRVELGLTDGANWSLWLEYWQALRDLPAAPAFDAGAVEWPQLPE